MSQKSLQPLKFNESNILCFRPFVVHSFDIRPPFSRHEWNIWKYSGRGATSYERFNKYQIRSTGSPKRFNNDFKSRVSDSKSKFAQPFAQQIKNKYAIRVCEVCLKRIGFFSVESEGVIEKFFIRFLSDFFRPAILSVNYDRMEYKTDLFTRIPPTNLRFISQKNFN